MKPPNVTTSILLPVLLWLWRFLWRRAFNALAILWLTGLLADPASAGWFTRKPDPAIEAANRALEQAAQTANESARIQADQNIRIAEAIHQLSSERTQLTGHLERWRDFSARDSAWAAALESFGPTIVVALVLAVGGMALWLVTRSGPADAQLVSVLLDEVTSESPQWLAPIPLRPLLPADVNMWALVAANEREPDPDYDSQSHEPQEMPF
jgi:hypothetical protein